MPLRHKWHVHQLEWHGVILEHWPVENPPLQTPRVWHAHHISFFASVEHFFFCWWLRFQQVRLRSWNLPSKSASVTPVVVWGVRWFHSRILAIRVSTEPHWTALSTDPLLAGWCGDDLTWCIQLFPMNAANVVALVNSVPLSVTNLSGSPCVANIEQRCSMQQLLYEWFHF